ncbi:MAG TPA: rRNA maturation RNase YbeY [Actinomycetota bacterium]|nr:rRNA maturation RNase YbeY [Actinomycetota bacterium]
MVDDEPPLILVDDRQSMPLEVDVLMTVARECLVGEGAAHSELSVSFVTEDEMDDLHRRYMDEDGPTDVLSFPQDDDAAEGPRLLGDVVIAPSVAAHNNPGDPAGEMKLLLVHGILHLLGHDHDDEDERAAMWARQARYARVEA